MPYIIKIYQHINTQQLPLLNFLWQPYFNQYTTTPTTTVINTAKLLMNKSYLNNYIAFQILASSMLTDIVKLSMQSGSKNKCVLD